MRQIILASASPRRKELLKRTGLRFKTEPSNYKEEIPAGLEPHELARNISLEKAQVVATKHRSSVVIAADTIVVLDSHIMGKPHTDTDAHNMLELLGGRTHSVITGFSIIDTANNKTISRSVETMVYFKKLATAEIDAYVQTGEPLDKAGAYAIQGLGALLIERIEGDYYNVIGLPLSALAGALKEFGINILSP